MISNTLTIVNTDLLVASGACSLYAAHTYALSACAASALAFLSLLVYGSSFLLLQAGEYIHLY